LRQHARVCPPHVNAAASLQADYGIVLGSNRMLRRVAAEFGVALEPLCAAPFHDAGHAGKGGSLLPGGRATALPSTGIKGLPSTPC